MIDIPKTKSRGFSLLETVIYVSVLAVSFAITVNILISMTRSYRSFAAIRAENRGASSALEIISREIRRSTDLSSASVLGFNPGRLVLLNETSTTEIYLDDGVLMIKKDSVVVGPLTGSDTKVENLIFRSITSPRSKGVKVEMRIKKDFYTTAVLRGSY